MIEFARLFERIDQTTSTNAKVDAMAEYFASAPPDDAAWAVFFLTGRRLKRLIPFPALRDWTLAASATFAPTARAVPPAAVIAATVSLPFSSVKSTTATVNPSAASRMAVPAPIPRPAPVTSTVFRLSPRSIAPLNQ